MIPSFYEYSINALSLSWICMDCFTPSRTSTRLRWLWRLTPACLQQWSCCLGKFFWTFGCSRRSKDPLPITVLFCITMYLMFSCMYKNMCIYIYTDICTDYSKNWELVVRILCKSLYEKYITFSCSFLFFTPVISAAILARSRHPRAVTTVRGSDGDGTGPLCFMAFAWVLSWRHLRVQTDSFQSV